MAKGDATIYVDLSKRCQFCGKTGATGTKKGDEHTCMRCYIKALKSGDIEKWVKEHRTPTDTRR